MAAILKWVFKRLNSLTNSAEILRRRQCVQNVASSVWSLRGHALTQERTFISVSLLKYEDYFIVVVYFTVTFKVVLRPVLGIRIAWAPTFRRLERTVRLVIYIRIFGYSQLTLF